jgi:predicted DCC family thiol-disulfide oxidoreductase YuxK
MPAAPEPPREPADAPASAPVNVAPDRFLASTSQDALAPASVGVLAPVLPGDRLAAIPVTEIIFYDGHCGFCHRAVRWVLKRDPAGLLFRFAPLQGATFQKLVPAFYRATLPDTIVLRTSDGELLVRSDAFTHILRLLGGGRRPVATILNFLPHFIRDGVYDFVARTRHQLFARPTDTCPVLRPDQRARFDD